MKSIVLCGHNKCGTRWLANLVAGSSTLHLISPERRGLIESDLDETGIARFHAMIEESPTPILFDCPHAIQNPEILTALKRIDPNMGAIIIYRQPVDVMLSMHNYQRWSYKDGTLFGTPSNINVNGRVRDDALVQAIIDGPLTPQYEDLYRYDRNAKRLRQNFPRFLELLYDDLCEDPHEFVATVFRFCGARLDIEINDERINRSLAVRSWFADQLIAKSFNVLTGMNSRALYDRFKSGKLGPSPYRLLLRLNDKPAHFLSDSERQRLKVFFAPMVREFDMLTELDLGRWEYQPDPRMEANRRNATRMAS